MECEIQELQKSAESPLKYIKAEVSSLTSFSEHGQQPIDVNTI